MDISIYGNFSGLWDIVQGRVDTCLVAGGHEVVVHAVRLQMY
jgi:hypothetical protein